MTSPKVLKLEIAIFFGNIFIKKKKKLPTCLVSKKTFYTWLYEFLIRLENELSNQFQHLLRLFLKKKNLLRLGEEFVLSNLELN